MKYIYELDGVLLKIDQKIGKSRYKTQWSREENTGKLINQIIYKLKEHGNKSSAINVFLDTSPESTKIPIEVHLKSIA